jgi:hypothetical protein
LRTIFGILALTCGATLAMAGTICPGAATGTNFVHPPDPSATGCNVVITIASNGSVSTAVTDAAPYDGSEDVLIGVKNNSGSSVTSLAITGSGVFGFDGDGVCTFTFSGSSYCSSSQIVGTDPQDYQGPTSTFSNFSSGSSGTVTFSPAIAANGGSTYFSLEGVPTASLGVIVGNAPPTTPAPASLMLLGIGLACLAAWQLGARAFSKS